MVDARPRALGRAQRPVRLLLALFLALSGAFAVLWAGASPAHAADDQIDSFTIDYDMQPSGVLKAKETIVWRFGSNSGRHGIKRNFIIREKYDDTQDAVYTITNIDVETSAGVSNQFSSSVDEQEDGRLEIFELKIGDPDETISADTATYTISYDVTGAMRTFPNENPPYDEFFWDAIGTGNPAISKVVDHRQGARRRPGQLLLRRPGPEHGDLRRRQDRQRRHGHVQPGQPAGRIRASRSGSRSLRAWSPTTSRTSSPTAPS